jgi:23S rRNA (guanosine2251-2'-O)-methyltransferase
MSKTIVSGRNSVSQLIEQQPETIVKLCVSNRGDARLQGLITAAKSAGISVEFFKPHALELKAGGTNHQGVVAEAQLKTYAEADIFTLIEGVAQPRVLVLDGVQDPQNLGACLLSADALGVHVVVVPDNGSAPLNEGARKVASGAAEVLPCVRVKNLNRVLEKLKDQGVWLVGLAGEAEKTLADIDVNQGLAIVMGAEQEGMRALTRKACDYLVKIPMCGSVESLNVSVATGIALYALKSN